MTKVPSLGYEKVIAALRRDGWVIVRQKGSHIRLQKNTRHEVLKLTVFQRIDLLNAPRYPIF